MQKLLKGITRLVNGGDLPIIDLRDGLPLPPMGNRKYVSINKFGVYEEMDDGCFLLSGYLRPEGEPIKFSLFSQEEDTVCLRLGKGRIQFSKVPAGGSRDVLVSTFLWCMDSQGLFD